MKRNLIDKYSISIFISIIIWLISFMVENVDIAIWALFAAYIPFTIMAYKNENSKFLLLFQISMFIFLLGSIFMNFLSGNHSGLEDEFGKKTIFFTISILWLNQICMYIGYRVAEGKKRKSKLSKVKKSVNKNIQKISTWILIITFIAKIFIELEKITIVSKYGYVGSYLHNSSSIAGIFFKIAQFYTIFLWIFLFSSNNKKKNYYALVSNVFIGILELGTGKRGPFIISILMSLLYLYYKNKTDKRKWINDSMFKYAILVLPIVIVVFQKFTYYRLNIDVDYTALEYLKNAFESSSSEIIAYGKELVDQIPKRSYTFGLIWMVLFRNQTIFSKIFGLTPLMNQTIEMVREGNSYGQIMTYLVEPSVFFRGGGVGSCFLAESYQDFKIWGVIGFSFFYGYLLYYLYNRTNNNLYREVLFFLMMSNLLMAPRDSVFSFICNTFSLTNILALVTLKLFVDLWENKRC